MPPERAHHGVRSGANAAPPETHAGTAIRTAAVPAMAVPESGAIPNSISEELTPNSNVFRPKNPI